MTIVKLMRSIAPNDRFPITWPKLASVKLDGIRLAKVDGKSCTKSGKEIPNRHIRKFIEEFLPEGFDCEVGSGKPTDPDFYLKSFSAAMTIEGTPDFTLFVFDLHNQPTSYASERYEKLAEIVRAQFPEQDSPVKLVEKVLIHSQIECDAMYAKALADGYEGLILQEPTGLYKFGRSTPKCQTQLKLKPEKDAEALVLSAYEGESNTNEAFTNEIGETKRSSHQSGKVPNGMLGGFRVKDCESGEVFNVAPGKLTHEERIRLWKLYKLDKSTLDGKYITYRCLDYGTKDAARHGRFYRFRSPVDMEPSQK